jgi:DNA-binding Xre family transcriptional regulator
MQAKTYVVDKVKVQRLMLDKWGTAEQKRLVEETGVSEQTLIRIFKGHGFSPESLYSICEALGCSPDEILTVAPKEPTLVRVAA